VVKTLWGFVALILLAACAAGGQSGSPIVFRNTNPPVAYVGSKSCTGSRCHDATSRDYPQTPMGHSMAPANTPAELEKAPKLATVFDSKLNRYFEVYRDGSSLYQSEYQLDENGKAIFKTQYRLDYVVGAGFTGYTYLFHRDNWLFEAPLSYYTKTQQWELSPGYATQGQDHGFTRPITTRCLVCHNGQPEPEPGRDGMYKAPPFRFGEHAISCEACHGPGELHVRELAKGHGRKRPAVDTSIVNPARLSSRLADDICMSCHQMGAPDILQPGKEYLDFRPGAPLYQTVALFKLPVREDQRAEADRLETLPPVRGSLEIPLWWKISRLEMSKCFQASQGRLSCITCHVIHHPPTPENQVAYYREKCLGCHTNASCRLAVKERMQQQPPNDCVGCHMPRRMIAGIPHSDDTSHRIVVRAGQALPDMAFQQPPPDLPGLLCLNRPKDDPLPLLTKLAAYAGAMRKDPSLKKDYLEVLEQLRQSVPEDPKVLTALGLKAVDERDDAKAVDYFSRALDHGPQDPTTLLHLGEALAQSGKGEEAGKVLERLVAAYPYARPYRRLLAICYLKENDEQRAREVMKQQLEFFPEDSLVRELLKKLEAPGP
jgi:hypothetical protein